MKARPQNVHRNGDRLSCTLPRCRSRADAEANESKHLEHWYGLSPVCRLWCTTKSDSLLNALWQMTHVRRPASSRRANGGGETSLSHGCGLVGDAGIRYVYVTGRPLRRVAGLLVMMLAAGNSAIRLCMAALTERVVPLGCSLKLLQRPRC